MVPDHDVTRPQGGDEDLLNIGLERRAVDRAVQHKGRHNTAPAQPGHDGDRLPAPVRHADPQTPAARGTSITPGHVRGSPGLVDEDQPFGIEIELALEPRRAPLSNVRPVLLGGMRGLFLREMLWRWQKRQSAATLT